MMKVSRAMCDICHGRGYWVNSLDTNIPCTFCEDTSSDDPQPTKELVDAKELYNKSVVGVRFTQNDHVVTPDVESWELYFRNSNGNNVKLNDRLNREWSNISSEEYRTYNFGKLGEVTIHNPIFLNVSPSGGHRILDKDEKSHYIPPGWLNITWAGSPHFVK